MKTIVLTILVFWLTQSVFAQDTTAKLDSLFKAYTQVEKFNGSVLVARHGKILLSKGYGYKNFKDNLPNDPNTIFQIASVTKQFTSAVILKLIELKELSLNDKLSKYYPDYPKGDSITIENLLTHTSGIFEWTNNTIGFGPTGEQSMLAFLETKQLDFSPGTSWSYSNSNYSLLGYIIQKVTGLTYENAVRKYIFNPLKMTNSGFDFKHLVNTEKATGYSIFSDSSKIEGTLYDSVGSFAAGEIYSTVLDLYKWQKGLQSNRILQKSSLEKAYTPFKNHYAYGWIIDSLFGNRVTSHSGSISGFSSNLARTPEDDVFVVMLNNIESGSLEKITKTVFAIIYNQPYFLPVKRHPIILSEAILRKYLGTYEVVTSHGSVFGDVTLENGKLLLQPRGGAQMELFAESENHFYDLFEDNEGDVEFVLDSNGDVSNIILSQNGQQSMTGKKVK